MPALRHFEVFGADHAGLRPSRQIRVVDRAGVRAMYHCAPQVDPREARNPVAIYGPNGPRVFEEPTWEVLT